MALSCREIVELVGDYLDGALDEATARLVRSHLDRCDGCERYVEQMRLTTAALAEIPGENLPAAARDTLMAAFRDYRG